MGTDPKIEKLLERYAPERREALRKILLGTAIYAAPVIASYSMQNLGGVAQAQSPNQSVAVPIDSGVGLAAAAAAVAAAGAFVLRRRRKRQGPRRTLKRAGAARPLAPVSRRPDRPRVTAALIVRDEERFLARLPRLARRPRRRDRRRRHRLDRPLARDRARARRPRGRPSLDRRLRRRAQRGARRGARRLDPLHRRGRTRRGVGSPERSTALLARPRRASRARCCSGPQTGFTRYREHRLFRRRADVRFRGVIHESILPAIARRPCMREGGRIDDSDGRARPPGLRRRPRREAPPQPAAARGAPRGRARPCLQPRPPRPHAARDSATRRGAEAGVAARDRLGACARIVHEPGEALPFLHLASFLLDRGRDARAILDEGRRALPGRPRARVARRACTARGGRSRGRAADLRRARRGRRRHAVHADGLRCIDLRRQRACRRRPVRVSPGALRRKRRALRPRRGARARPRRVPRQAPCWRRRARTPGASVKLRRRCVERARG